MLKGQPSFRFVEESSAADLERMNQSSISLTTLSSRIGEVHNDPKLPRFHDDVDEKLNHLKVVAGQLGEDILDYPHLVFTPGKLLEAIDALISTKEEALATAKAKQDNRLVSLCEDFLHGRCLRGVTCNESHALDDLHRYVVESIKVMCDGGCTDVFTVLHPFGEESWSAIVKALLDRNFSSLVVRECDAVALQSVAKCLKKNLLPMLKCVDLSKNRIAASNPQGLLRLARALSSCTTVESLSIGYNNLGASGALAVTQSLAANLSTSLIALNLSGNGIVFHDPAFSYLCEALSCIRLQKLSVAQNLIGADGVKKLTASLSSTEGTALEESNKRSGRFLEFLDISGTQCGDQGGAAIAAFLASAAGSKLRYLHAGWNRLTFETIVAICVSLESHTRLEVLKLPYNLGVGRKGSIAIAEYIKKNNVISSIDLRWTAVGDDGAATIAEAISTNRQAMRTLSLYGNDLDARTENLVADRMKKALGNPHLEKGLTKLTVSDEVW